MSLKMPSAVYDVLKYIQRIALPALATFYGTIAVVFKWPYTEQVLTVFAATITLMGKLLQVSHDKYKESDGDINEEDLP